MEKKSSLLPQEEGGWGEGGSGGRRQIATCRFPHDDLLEADWLQGPVIDFWQDEELNPERSGHHATSEAFDIKNV